MVFGCLSFPTHLKVEFSLSFSTFTTERRERELIVTVGERFLRRRSFLFRNGRKACLQKENLKDTQKRSRVEHERDLLLLVETHTQKRRLLLETIKSKNFFELLPRDFRRKAAKILIKNFLIALCVFNF